MSTDHRQLLEFAAKAAGIEIYFDDDGDCYRVKESGNRHYWNPILFDGDALRLAVKLNFRLECMTMQTAASTFDRKTSEPVDHTVDQGRLRWPFEQCPYAATRLAIVRAAAEIGKVIP
jgi:hypothetical protein